MAKKFKYVPVFVEVSKPPKGSAVYVKQGDVEYCIGRSIIKPKDVNLNKVGDAGTILVPDWLAEKEEMQTEDGDSW